MANDYEQDDEDFPTDEQVRLYAEACLSQNPGSMPCDSRQQLALYDPPAFIRQFLTQHPEVRNMKHLGAGRYEIDYD